MKIKFSLFLLVVFPLYACATGSTQTVSPASVLPTITNTMIIPAPTETILPTPTLTPETFPVSSELALQVDNTLQGQRLPNVAFQDIPFSRIGHMDYLGFQNVTAADYLDSAVRWGYKWMRVNTDWYDWPEAVKAGEYSDYTISPSQDETIDLLVQNGIQLLYTITYWDPQIKVTSGYTRFRTQDEIDRYLDYVRFIVGHFKGKIQWYDILNEPNLKDGQRAVRVNDYINLARQVIPVIKEIDPQAKVVIGEVTSLYRPGALDYLKTILSSDVLLVADGIAWHGGSCNSPDYQPDFYRNYSNLVDEIVTTAHTNGFKGQFFATELSWRTVNTLQPIEEAPPCSYSDIVAAKYYARGMTINLSKGFWISVGHENYQNIPEVVKVITSLTKLLGGAQPEQIPVTFSKDSPELRSVAFSLPDGSRLVAVWRDVKAMDNDSGVETTITIPQVHAQKVIGVDPLYAFQQELISTQEGGLNIPGYLIRDYPTFILIEGYSQTP